MRASLLTLLLALSVVSCISIPRHEEIYNVIPGEADLPGWEIAQKSRVYGIKDIPVESDYTLILDYDIKEKSSTQYRNINSDEKVDLNIYLSDHQLASFGFSSQLRNMGYKPVNRMGEIFYLSEDTLLYYKGRYVVTIRADFTLLDDESKIYPFFDYVSSKIPDQHRAPLLRIFPDGVSLKYYPDYLSDYFGLRRLLVKRTIKNGVELNYFMAYYRESRDALLEYDRIIRSYGLTLDESEGVRKAFVKSERGFSMIALYENYIFGVKDVLDMKDGSELVSNISFLIKSRN